MGFKSNKRNKSDVEYIIRDDKNRAIINYHYANIPKGTALEIKEEGRDFFRVSHRGRQVYLQKNLFLTNRDQEDKKPGLSLSFDEDT